MRGLVHHFRTVGLPDEVLVPWLPKLVVSLRPLGPAVIATLVKEAGLAFPRSMGELGAWEPAWERRRAEVVAAPAAQVTEAPAVDLSPDEAAAARLLRDRREVVEVVAALAARSAAAG